MGRRLVVVMLLFAVPPAVWGQDDPEVRKALAGLQRATQKIILQAEPSIACILVSRSDDYQRVADKEHPGRLGTFDPLSIKAFTDKDRLLKQKRLDLADPGHIPQAFGSGVVIDAGGLVLTNYHVIVDATKIYVRLPGGKGSYADIHAADPRSDLAVLKLISQEVLPLKVIALGDADKLERGQFVLTLANPFAAGFRDGQPSASAGILSNIRRRALRHFKEEERVRPLQYYGTLLQTDARLHLGCSGGALLNLNGELVGLLTSLAAIQGGDSPGGFAIPISGGMRRIIDVLKRGEEVDYGYLGIGFDERGANGNNGVLLSVVGRGSPAEVDGKLKSDDILVAVNGQPIRDSDDIFVTIGTYLAGTKIQLQVRRDGNERLVDVTLAKLHVPGKKIASSLGARPFFRGLRADYGSLAVQQPPKMGHIPPGVLISDVLPNSSADRANLKSGDIITQVNQQPVATPAAFYQAVQDARGPIELSLYNFPQAPTRVLLK